MKTYSVEQIKKLLAELDDFNKQDLANIQLTEGGVAVDISKVLKDWKFIGLSNASFVELEYWNNG